MPFKICRYFGFVVGVMNRNALVTLSFAFCIMLGVAAIYWQTSGLTLISYGDAAELMAAGHILGIPHAPGYPLLMLLSHAATNGYAGDFGHAFSLFTAGISVITIGLVFLANRKMIGLLPATIAALTLAFIYPFWLYSLVPEVSALNGCFIAGLLALALWEPPAVWRPWQNAGFACWLGLSLAHHHTVVLLLPGLWIHYLLTHRQEPWYALFQGRWLICFLLGLLPYLYLPWAASGHPAINALAQNDNQELWRFILRMNYGSWRLVADAGSFSWPMGFQIGVFYFSRIVAGLTLPGSVLALIGAIELWQKSRPRFWLLAISWFLLGPGFYLMARVVPVSFSQQGLLEKFIVPSFIVGVFFVGAGCQSLLAAVKGLFNHKPVLQQILYFSVGLVLLLILPGSMLPDHYARVDKSNYQLSKQYAHDLFASFQPGSLVLVHGDNSLFTCLYTQQVERRYLDMEIKNIAAPGSRELLAAAMGNRPVMVVGLPGEEWAAYGLLGNPWQLSARGLAFEVLPNGQTDENDPTVWDKFIIPSDLAINDQQDYFTRETIWLYAIARFNQAVMLKQKGRMAEAKTAAEAALRLYPDFSAAKQLVQTIPLVSSPSPSPAMPATFQNTR